MQVLIAEKANLANGLPNETHTKLKSIIEDINSVLKTVSYDDDNNDDHNKVDDSTQGKAQSSIQNSAALEKNKRLGQEKDTHTPFPGISRLTPNLFLCGAAAVVPVHLEKLDVRLVINVAPELPDTPLPNTNPPIYLRINAQDRPEVDLAAHFEEVADLIEQVCTSGGSCLIHCVAGVSRSASLCLAYLMKYGGMTLRDAFTHVRSIRPQIRPNSGFFQQLRKYEKELQGTCSVQMVYFASLDKEIPDILEPEYRAMEDFYQRYRSSLKRR